MPYSSNGTFLVVFDGDTSGDSESEATPSTDAPVAPADPIDSAKAAAEEWDSDFSGYYEDEDLWEDVDDDEAGAAEDGANDRDAKEDGEDREVDLTDGQLRGIYKPLRTERPLWDFPEGLYRREVATYEMSAWLGWDIIPTTVLVDGPLGIGSLQRFIEADFAKHYFNHLEDESLHPQLQTLCTLDLLTNQTDRKGGHCLIDADNRIWGIDNGLSFHAEFKVRTVIWDFAGEPIAESLLTDLDRLVDQGVPETVTELVGDTLEQDALIQRAKALIEAAQFPHDRTGRRYPWPMI